MQSTLPGFFLGAVLLSTAVTAADTLPVTYEKTIRPFMAGRCFTCHGPGSPSHIEFDKDMEGFKKQSKGPRMTSYEDLMVFVNGDDAGALMRRLDDGKNTKDGKPGNMHTNLGATDAERATALAMFKQWTGVWSLKRSNGWSPVERQAVKAAR